MDSPALAEVVRRADAVRDQVESRWLGSVGVRDFCHYASAVGDDGYVRSAVDRELAGLPVSAPPLFVPGVFSYDYGPPESELNESGVEPGGSPCTQGLPVVQVHGGETVQLLGPVFNGDTLWAKRAIRSAVHKRGASGEFVVLTWTTEISSEGRGPVCAIEESLIVRDAQ
jgi:hypothetical protein